MHSVDFARYRPFCLRAGGRSLSAPAAGAVGSWHAIDQLTPDGQGEQALKAHFAGLLGAGRGCDADDETIQAFQGEADTNRQLPLL